MKQGFFWPPCIFRWCIVWPQRIYAYTSISNVYITIIFFSLRRRRFSLQRYVYVYLCTYTWNTTLESKDECVTITKTVIIDAKNVCHDVINMCHQQLSLCRKSGALNQSPIDHFVIIHKGYYSPKDSICITYHCTEWILCSGIHIPMYVYESI